MKKEEVFEGREVLRHLNSLEIVARKSTEVSEGNESVKIEEENQNSMN